jgi:hypothetical protein
MLAWTSIVVFGALLVCVLSTWDTADECVELEVGVFGCTVDCTTAGAAVRFVVSVGEGPRQSHMSSELT